MLHLITGGSGSGKSVYGEKMIMNTNARYRYYVATMHPWGREGEERVRRHQRQRQGKGFSTLEVYDHLEQAVFEGKEREHTAVLLECMSNLAANEMFDVGGSREEILERIFKGIQHLQDWAENVVVVTNEVFSDGVIYGKETREYLQLLAQVNGELARRADRVTEVVFGIPVPVKPLWHSIQKAHNSLFCLNGALEGSEQTR